MTGSKAPSGGRAGRNSERRERKEDFKRGGNADGYWRILGTWETVWWRVKERGRGGDFSFWDGVSLIFQDLQSSIF